MAPTISRTVGRLAPSPTGVLHVGNARSLLWAWLSARSQGGRVLLRIEDLLPGAPEHVASVLHDLTWLGLDWDDPGDVVGRLDPSDFDATCRGRSALVLQSERAEIYRTALERLSAHGLVYACSCTRKDIENALRAPHAEDKALRYPGLCRGRYADLSAALRAEAAAAGRAGKTPTGAAQRLRVPRSAIDFVDAFAGPQRQDVDADSGDFVVRRKDGTAAYMLAVVVDDRAMGVTEVVRGDDLLEVTGQQLWVHRALSTHVAQGELGGPGPASEPRFCHVPLVLGDDGRRLAKRNRSLHVRTLIERGVAPASLRAWLAASMGLPPSGDLPTLVDAYRVAAAAGGLRREAVIFDQPELAALELGEVPPLRAAAGPSVAQIPD